MTLKRQILTKFYLQSIAFYCAMLIACIGFLIGINYKIVDGLEAKLYGQVNNNTNEITKTTSSLFDSILSRASEGCINTISFSSEETYRTNYSMGYTESYIDDVLYKLKQPISYNKRQNNNVSITASDYRVPYIFPNTIWNMTLEQNKTRDLSANLDPIFISLYRNNENFVALYAGYEDGVFRYYPGKSTILTDPERTYDPRIRKWYKLAMTYPNRIVITEPYLDFNGLGWMITIARTINNAETGDIIGVAGGDLLLSDIYKTISNIAILKTGKLSIFDSNGNIIADKDWNQTTSNITSPTYSILNSPKISNEVWNIIENIGNYTASNIEFSSNGDIYIAYIYNTIIYNNRYTIVSFIKKNEITDTLISIDNEMENINNIVSPGLVGLCIVIFIIFTCISNYTISNLLKPLDVIRTNIKKVLANVGGNLADDVDIVPTSNVDEMNEFGESFNRLVSYLRTWREQNVNNQYYIGDNRDISQQNLRYAPELKNIKRPEEATIMMPLEIDTDNPTLPQ